MKTHTCGFSPGDAIVLWIVRIRRHPSCEPTHGRSRRRGRNGLHDAHYGWSAAFCEAGQAVVELHLLTHLFLPLLRWGSQNNAELAVREMLRSVAASHGAILQAEDFLDDGSRIRLQVPLTSRPPHFTNPPGVPSMVS